MDFPVLFWYWAAQSGVGFLASRYAIPRTELQKEHACRFSSVTITSIKPSRR